ncbi:MAG TPA: hypothetical protein PLQ11_06030 [Beijerinckiaceae bacterium]|nr:hypothetical protein [Beijerinckiaceae bacterium]
MRSLRSILCAVAVVSAAVPASAECSLSKLMFNFGETTTQYLDVRQGEYCSGDLKMPGVTVFRIEVDKQPKNGLVSVNQKTYVWKYRPFKNFTGQDEMVLRLYGYSSRTNNHGAMVFKIRVL